MDINGLIYIYYNNDTDKVLLNYYKKLLIKNASNKDEIIRIFKTKFLKDFIESSRLLINTNNLYPAALLLSSCIDILAKHYAGETTIYNVGANYLDFSNNFFAEFKLHNMSSDFYKNFRCSLVHSNSTAIDFTINDSIEVFCKSDGKKVINLSWLVLTTEKILNNYISLIECDNEKFKNFIAVQKHIYK